jgi:hypothetical protein
MKYIPDYFLISLALSLIGGSGALAADANKLPPLDSMQDNGNIRIFDPGKVSAIADVPYDPNPYGPGPRPHPLVKCLCLIGLSAGVSVQIDVTPEKYLGDHKLLAKFVSFHTVGNQMVWLRATGISLITPHFLGAPELAACKGKTENASCIASPGGAHIKGICHTPAGASVRGCMNDILNSYVYPGPTANAPWAVVEDIHEVEKAVNKVRATQPARD